MTGKTHLTAGALAAVFLVRAEQGEPLLVLSGCVGATLLGSLFPDIDLETSKLGHAVYPLAKLLNRTVGHRTVFHAPLLYLALCALLIPQFPRWTPCIISFAVGAGTHIGLDALNPAGVPLFWPWKKRLSLASIDTGRRAEALLRGLMLLAIPLCVVAFWVAPQLLHIR